MERSIGRCLGTAVRTATRCLLDGEPPGGGEIVADESFGEALRSKSEGHGLGEVVPFAYCAM